MTKLWLMRLQNASKSLTISEEKNAAKSLVRLRFIGYFGKIE
jgi:hypothetical protein